MNLRSSSKNKVRTPWAGTDPLELGAESTQSDTNPPMVHPTTAAVNLAAPRAMDRARGKQSEAFASMASGARDGSTFDTFYRKHLKILNGEKAASSDLGNPGSSELPSLPSYSPSTNKVVLAPISHHTSSAPVATSSSTGQSDSGVGVMDFERSMLGALTAGVTGKVGGGKRVRGVGGVVYKGATMQSSPTTLDCTESGTTPAKVSDGRFSNYHISGPVPDETSSRANRLQQGAHHRTVATTTTTKEPAHIKSSSTVHNDNDCSPRQRKRLHHEAAVAEGRRWVGTNVTIIPGLSPEVATDCGDDNLPIKKGMPSLTSRPPNARAAARLALVSRTNELAVAATKPRGKIDDDIPLVQRKQGQWASERGDAVAGFPSVWECQRHIVIPPPRGDDWAEIEEGTSTLLDTHDHDPTYQQSPIKKGPSCLPSDRDDGGGLKSRIPGKGGPHLPASHGSPPPRHDARLGRGTTKLIPPTIHPLTSSEGGRYFIAPEPTSYQFNHGNYNPKVGDTSMPVHTQGGGDSTQNSPPKKNKIHVSVSRTGRFVSPSPTSSHRHQKHNNTLGGSQSTAPTLSPATEQMVAHRVQALLADSKKSLAQHRDIMSALSKWEKDRSHPSEQR